MKSFILVFLALLTGAAIAKETQCEYQTDTPISVRQGGVGSVISSPGAQLNATNDGSNVQIKLARTPITKIPCDSKSNGEASFATWSITADAPLGKSEKSRSIFSLDGLGNATTIGINVSNLTTKWQADNQELEDQRKKNCLALDEKVKRKNNGTLPPGYECSHKWFAEYLPELVSSQRRAKPGPAAGYVVLGGSMKYGVQDVTFYDESTLAKSVQRKKPWSVGIYLGWNPAQDDTSLFIVKIDRVKAVESKDTSVRCPVSTGSATVQCVSGAFGTPDIKIGNLLTLEGRKAIGGQYGVSLALSHDFKTKRSAVEVPFYLLSSSEGVPVGGVKLGWRSDDKSIVLGVFVGIPFTVVP